MKSQYHIAELSLDVDGTYWVHYIGNVPEQGGMVFGKGSVGFKVLLEAVKFLESTINKHLPTYQERIFIKESLP